MLLFFFLFIYLTNKIPYDSFLIINQILIVYYLVFFKILPLFKKDRYSDDVIILFFVSDDLVLKNGMYANLE